ncbi:MAG TPA: hypothetical protein VLF20_01810 [Patescibacteria group bacterium]|nr:hypothetical protein [Patescibacteria group bacterium]
MIVEAGSGRNRRLKGRAVTFRRVEAFIRQHPQLHPDQVAELSRITRDFLEVPSSGNGS